MIKTFKQLPVFLLLFTSIPALAGSCPKDMKKIDALLAENPSMSASQMTRIKELRVSGEKLHKSGNHQESVTALHEALKLLNM